MEQSFPDVANYTLSKRLDALRERIKSLEQYNKGEERKPTKHEVAMINVQAILERIESLEKWREEIDPALWPKDVTYPWKSLGGRMEIIATKHEDDPQKEKREMPTHAGICQKWCVGRNKISNTIFKP